MLRKGGIFSEGKKCRIVSRVVHPGKGMKKPDIIMGRNKMAPRQLHRNKNFQFS